MTYTAAVHVKHTTHKFNACQMYNMFRVYLHFGKVESLFIPVQRPIPWYQGTLFSPYAYTLSCHCVLGRSA